MADQRSHLAKTRDDWFESDEGKKCCEGQAFRQYLKNRLELAFIAGYDARANMAVCSEEWCTNYSLTCIGRCKVGDHIKKDKGHYCRSSCASYSSSSVGSNNSKK